MSFMDDKIYFEYYGMQGSVQVKCWTWNQSELRPAPVLRVFTDCENMQSKRIYPMTQISTTRPPALEVQGWGNDTTKHVKELFSILDNGIWI